LSLWLINAAISFAEEVEVGGSVIAVNGSAHPFKVLEPIDDAVKRLPSQILPNRCPSYHKKMYTRRRKRVRSKIMTTSSMPAAKGTGVLGKAMNGIKVAGEGVLSIAGSTVSGVKNLTGSAVESVKEVAASATESDSKATDIFGVLTTQSDDLVKALMGVFAVFLFKTVVCPMLVLIGLWKLTGSFELMQRDRNLLDPGNANY
jgi:hypothetical protein